MLRHIYGKSNFDRRCLFARFDTKMIRVEKAKLFAFADFRHKHKLAHSHMSAKTFFDVSQFVICANHAIHDAHQDTLT